MLVSTKKYGTQNLGHSKNPRNLLWKRFWLIKPNGSNNLPKKIQIVAPENFDPNSVHSKDPRIRSLDPIGKSRFNPLATSWIFRLPKKKLTHRKVETCCSSSLWLFDDSNGGHLNTTPKGSQGRSWVSALFKQNVCVCVCGCLCSIKNHLWFFVPALTGWLATCFVFFPPSWKAAIAVR